MCVCLYGYIYIYICVCVHIYFSAEKFMSDEDTLM